MFDLSNLTVSNPTRIGISTSSVTGGNHTMIGVCTSRITTSNTTSYGSSIGLEGVTHISNLDFLLLRDPTVLPYPFFYSESESLELLYSWQHFFFYEPFWVFLTAFLSFEKHSMNCAKEL